MKLFLLVLGLFSVMEQGAHAASSAIPAAPVDPNQAPLVQPVSPRAEPVTSVPAANNPTTNTVDPSIPQVSVLAESSLRNVLQELAQTWADAQPDSPKVPLTLTNVATMRSQLESNPTWDVVIGAGGDEMKTMTEKGLLAPDGQRTLARNSVVIYGRKALLKDDALEWFDLIGTEWKKVALGNAQLTSSGRVAERALQKHGLADEDHKDVFTYAGTEALALQVAEREQADAVFLYRTDLAGAAAIPGFEVLPIDSTDAPPVFYQAAVGRLAKNPDGARSFILFCGSDAARPIWIKYGFETD